MSSGGVRDVKVVIIDTQYVETDAISFKSVVQSLTGKDSAVRREGKPSSSEKQTRVRGGGGVGGGGGGGAVLTRGLSLKDFDRLLMELPPLEELYRLFAD